VVDVMSRKVGRALLEQHALVNLAVDKLTVRMIHLIVSPIAPAVLDDCESVVFVKRHLDDFVSSGGRRSGRGLTTAATATAAAGSTARRTARNGALTNRSFWVVL
jgi:hypothetical protein